MRALLLSTLGLSLAIPAAAQFPDFDTVEIKVEHLAPGVAVLFGAGGNIAVSYGPDGAVLIDDQFGPLTPKIQAAVATLGASPVKFLINTHWHYDHSGGNENLGKAGALIIAHDNVRVRMDNGGEVAGRSVPAAAKIALPVVTYTDGLKLHVNGDLVSTQYLGRGHTDGDSIVLWKIANVVHMGDLFLNGGLPFIDLNSGGDAVALLATIEKALLLTNAQTKIIPGHGAMATQADLIAWRDMLISVTGAVRKGIKAKRTLAQIQAMKPATRWETASGFVKGDGFVEAVYNGMTASHHHP
jgi:cyclase